ncbi:MAG: cytochrome c [Phycisphaeraceae bacterium]|nr:cytochrome c [Phycisphaeraceae bacterium]
MALSSKRHRLLLRFVAPIPIALLPLSLAPSCARQRTQPAQSLPPSDAIHDRPGVHNLHEVDDRLVSGSVPEGDVGFDTLASMGIRTIISVDGASPDVARAEARGMRYVHIPITYAQATERQQLEIARAVRDLPGPIYIHCHHGKHRGPAAAASAAVLLGVFSPEQGVAFMKTAGTAPSYSGLYACVAQANRASSESLDKAPHTFPSIQRARGIVAAMVEVDIAHENLAQIRAAGWTVPANHPDLVPAAEAGRQTDDMRLSAEDPNAIARGDDFMTRLAHAIAAASALEQDIVAGAPSDRLEARWQRVAASCTDCHTIYRNR